MNQRYRALYWTICFLCWGFYMGVASVNLDSLGIRLPADSSRKFVFTNKRAAFWYGETAQPNKDAFQGYTLLEQHVVRDYRIELDGRVLERGDAQEIVLYPDRLERRYAGVRETFYFLDSLNALLVRLDVEMPREVSFWIEWDRIVRGSLWQWEDDPPVAIGKLVRIPADKPGWCSLTCWGDAQLVTPIQQGRQPGRSPTLNEKPFPVEGLHVDAGKGALWFALVFARDSLQVLDLARMLRQQPDRWIQLRRRRMAGLLKRAGLSTGDSQLDRAYAWARISMDDLITRQQGPGIWAGLPWFNNYWGRDSFIAFTGALLCTGQYKLARQVLETFARFQDTNPVSPTFGRIPNRIRLHDVIYNTADGTPWFVLACERYVQYSGDRQFIERMFPVLKKVMDGAIENGMDEYGLLTHGDAETWMDAVGSDGPWSPRGNRAVEIQVLWLEQLRICADWAEKLGYPDWARQWRLIARRARFAFRSFFWDRLHHRLIDHLNPDNSPDSQVRPNSVFALTVPADSLLSPVQRRAVLAELVTRLTYPWGVSTLAQDDPQFHPYHHYPPYYPPDAAYHNGLVWTWLNGPLISALMPENPSLAWQLLREECRQILGEDAVGSQSELIEAWPRPGASRPRVSGAVSQAWNLAEFIRNVHQDVLGIHPRADEDRIVFTPHLEGVSSPVSFHFPFLNSTLRGRYEQQNERLVLALSGYQNKATLEVELKTTFAGRRVTVKTFWEGGKPLTLVLQKRDDRITCQVNGRPKPVAAVPYKSKLDTLRFVQSALDMTIPAFKGPAYDLIAPADALRRPSRLTRVVFDIADPRGDDRGPLGTYLYPRNPAFEPGIFDGRQVTIRRDDAYYYFEIKLENLVNPGWRPEAGFQLTYLAIALNFGDRAGVRTTRIGKGANYSVPLEYAYNYIIYVGHGYRVSDARGRIRAEYRPADPSQAIGDVSEKTIRFSVPIEYLSLETLRTAVVLIGGQDDHGGGGLGEFRAVLPEAGEWHGGGGKKATGNPAVYDEIYLRR